MEIRPLHSGVEQSNGPSGERAELSSARHLATWQQQNDANLPGTMGLLGPLLCFILDT